VVFLEPKRVYRAAKGEVPDGDYVVPLESASVVRPGRHVTVLAYGAMLYEALDAATKAAEKGIEAEVIDLRTLWPLDINTVVESVKRTGRLVVVHEAPRTGGFAGELITLVVERAMYHLEAPPIRVTGFDTPFPYALEMEYLPLSHRIVPAILSAVRS
jgi:2-oxoisovalerate dehydrogenase E1 component beta subunit